MEDNSAPLRLSSRALSADPSAIHLVEHKERLEAAVLRQDVPLCLDVSKAFLESIFKTILNDRVGEEELPSEFYPLFRKVKDEVPFNHNDTANNLIGRLAGSLVNVVAELRNNFGAASHGDDGYHENPIDASSADFVMSSVDGLAALVYSKHKNTIVPERATRINYQDFSEFNDWLDEQGEDYEIVVGEDTVFRYTASQVLYEQDISAYQEMLIQYMANEEGEVEGEQYDS
ncbi:abortive infection family protein [Alteromonas sp. K632G]|nr:abortive infection family protein [Alteromonas sp. K632G]